MSGSEPVANPIPDDAIVVRVDGSDTADRALAWAARYATLEDRPLVIAHALGTIGTPGAAAFALRRPHVRPCLRTVAGRRRSHRGGRLPVDCRVAPVGRHHRRRRPRGRAPVAAPAGRTRLAPRAA